MTCSISAIYTGEVINISLHVTPLLPTRWAVDGLEGATWRGLGLAGLLPKAAALVGFAGLFGTLAVVRFRWEEK